jgi:hypothetical protein
MRVTCGNGIAVEILGHNDIRRQRGRVSANLGGTGSPTGLPAALASPAMNSLRRISHALRSSRRSRRSLSRPGPCGNGGCTGCDGFIGPMMGRFGRTSSKRGPEEPRGRFRGSGFLRWRPADGRMGGLPTRRGGGILAGHPCRAGTGRVGRATRDKPSPCKPNARTARDHHCPRNTGEQPGGRSTCHWGAPHNETKVASRQGCERGFLQKREDGELRVTVKGRAALLLGRR